MHLDVSLIDVYFVIMHVGRKIKHFHVQKDLCDHTVIRTPTGIIKAKMSMKRSEHFLTGKICEILL